MVEKRLIGAIFRQTIKDWKKQNDSPDVQEFIASEWFAVLAEGLDLDPEVIRAKWKAGDLDLQNVSLRAAYR